MNYSPIIKILTLQSSIKNQWNKKLLFQAPTFKNNLFNTKYVSFLFFSVCTGHKRNIKEINENSYRLYRYQHVEVDSSLFVSERICGVRCRKLRHYSVIHIHIHIHIHMHILLYFIFYSLYLIFHSFYLMFTSLVLFFQYLHCPWSGPDSHFTAGYTVSV